MDNHEGPKSDVLACQTICQLLLHQMCRKTLPKVNCCRFRLLSKQISCRMTQVAECEYLNKELIT